MKHLFSILLLCLLLGANAVAQTAKPTLKVSANSTEVTNGVVEYKDQKRMLWIVTDGMPANSGYAYEFGPLYLVTPEGQRIVVKAKEVNNGPVFHYSLSKNDMSQHPNGFTLELDPIRRHNPDHSSEILPFDAQALQVKFVALPK